MKFRVLSAIICWIAGVSPAMGVVEPDSIEAKCQPFLKFESEELDMGIVEPDETSEGVIYFTNEGSAPLILTDVFAQCGCTVASFRKDSVAPGEKGKISVRYNSHGRSPGNFKKIVRVRSNASNSREFFYVKGVVKRKYMQ